VRRTSGTVTVASASTLTGNTSLDGTAGKTSVTFISDGAGWVSTVQF
jgi:autotransporter-associated beta strand protein